MFKKKVSKSEESETRLLGNVLESNGFYNACISKGDYSQGELYFVDNKTGKTFKVKQFNLRESKSPKVEANIVLDLSSNYHVEEVESAK